MPGYYFSGILGNLEMSSNSAKVREKAQSPGKVGGIFVVGEIWLCQLNKMTYLYFIRTVIHFSYVMFMENSD